MDENIKYYWLYDVEIIGPHEKEEEPFALDFSIRSLIKEFQVEINVTKKLIEKATGLPVGSYYKFYFLGYGQSLEFVFHDALTSDCAVSSGCYEAQPHEDVDPEEYKTVFSECFVKTFKSKIGPKIIERVREIEKDNYGRRTPDKNLKLND